MSDDRVRLEIAFEGGTALSMDVLASVADELDRALAGTDSGSLSFEAGDGRYTVAVRKIVFAKRFARDGRVGFGS
ncbi:MAG: hypothetical protein WCH31_02205 [Actinomycetes bacterium]